MMAFLEQAGRGCISGDVGDWPQLVPACKTAHKQLLEQDEGPSRLTYLEGYLECMRARLEDIRDDGITPHTQEKIAKMLNLTIYVKEKGPIK